MCHCVRHQNSLGGGGAVLKSRNMYLPDDDGITAILLRLKDELDLEKKLEVNFV